MKCMYMNVAGTYMAIAWYIKFPFLSFILFMFAPVWVPHVHYSSSAVEYISSMLKTYLFRGICK